MEACMLLMKVALRGLAQSIKGFRSFHMLVVFIHFLINRKAQKKRGQQMIIAGTSLTGILRIDATAAASEILFSLKGAMSGKTGTKLIFYERKKPQEAQKSSSCEATESCLKR
jgi:hypothetical protein